MTHLRAKSKLFSISFVFSLMLFMFCTIFNNIGFGSDNKAQSKMSAENAEFLSKVRYIITDDEEKFFKNLPDDKRGEFINQFWEARNPNPLSKNNEFKEEYFDRIEMANKKFSAGREGWLTDRGKTYILLGPPNYEENHHSGEVGVHHDYAVWHYSDFYIVFVDNSNDGDLQVDYSNLTNHADVQDAFRKAKQNLNKIENLLNFDFSYEKIKGNPTIIISINTDAITFKQEENKMVSNLEVSVNLKDINYNDVFNYKKDEKLEFSKTDSNIPSSIKIEIPLDKDKVTQGTYFCLTSVIRMDDKEKAFNNKMIKIK